MMARIIDGRYIISAKHSSARVPMRLRGSSAKISLPPYHPGWRMIIWSVTDPASEVTLRPQQAQARRWLPAWRSLSTCCRPMSRSNELLIADRKAQSRSPLVHGISRATSVRNSLEISSTPKKSLHMPHIDPAKDVDGLHPHNRLAALRVDCRRCRRLSTYPVRLHHPDQSVQRVARRHARPFVIGAV